MISDLRLLAAPRTILAAPLADGELVEEVVVHLRRDVLVNGRALGPQRGRVAVRSARFEVLAALLGERVDLRAAGEAVIAPPTRSETS